jgi:thiamine kinase-like enzyme
MNASIEQITAGYQREHQINREAVTAEQLPLSFEGITDRWLTAVICAKTPGAAVAGHELSAPDRGTTSRRKIYLKYNATGDAAGLPKSVFCKATHELQSRIILGSFGAVDSEIRFLTEIRPLLGIEAPEALYAHHDKEFFNSIIIMADLTADVKEFCDHKTVVSRQRAESQMKLLAALHGKTYGNEKLRSRTAAFSTFREIFKKLLKTGFREGSDAGFLASEEVIPKNLYKRHAEIWPATVAAVDDLERTPMTLAHGDVHLKNWYVNGNGEMGLGDWQCVARSNPVRDVAYALSTALTVDDRRAWERELVSYYLEQLASVGGPVIAFDNAWEIYRQQLVSALLFWTITIWPTALRPGAQPRDASLEFIKRIAAAMDDLGSLDARDS